MMGNGKEISVKEMESASFEMMYSALLTLGARKNIQAKDTAQKVMIHSMPLTRTFLLYFSSSFFLGPLSNVSIDI